MKSGILFISILIIAGCSSNPTDNSINIFSVNDDKQLGAQVAAEIAGNPQEYPLLSTTQYAASYNYVNAIRDKILNSGEVYYKDDFVWEIHIINDDNTLNAFCTPGGYIYVYTGLMKYLDNEDELAGVMAHEMAHADRRHTTDELTKLYGIQFLLDVILGNNQSNITNLAESLVFLQFSRDNEKEADEYSVRYLCPTDYNAAGAAGFFIKLEEEGQSSNPPVFLSDHPDPGDRINDINQTKSELGCTGTATYDQAYQNFLATLPGSH